LDTLAIANRLDNSVLEHAQTGRLPVLIEVHMGGEETKTGVEEAGLAALAAEIETLAHLELRGLMAIPPYSDDPQKARPYFAKLRELRDGLSRDLRRTLPVLSMGMSHDFDVAIGEGATEVRIGTAIFGSRILYR
jgi:PLP dependent protein